MGESLPPRLGRALLGLLEQEPMSGYEIRKLFATTPLEAFSDSPGSIYPALQRLERHGLIEGRAEKTESRRPRRVYELTDAGHATLRRWLMQPVTLDDVKRESEELKLRFAFMHRVIGSAEAVRFLAGWEAALLHYLPMLEAYLGAEGGEMPITGRLALESGVESVRCQLSWVRRAINELRATGAGG